MRGAVVAGMLVGVALAAAGEPPLPEVTAALQRIADQSTIELTTIGRRSGKPHTRPVWFVVSGGTILVQAGKDGNRDWFRNLQKNPTVTLRAGEYAFRARAAAVTDPARIEAVRQLFLQKYTSARLLSLVGSSLGQGAPAELAPLSVTLGK